MLLNGLLTCWTAQLVVCLSLLLHLFFSCSCAGAPMCWCAHLLAPPSIRPLACSLAYVLLWEYFLSLVYSCTRVLVYSCTRLLVGWCSDVLLCSCAPLLVLSSLRLGDGDVGKACRACRRRSIWGEKRYGSPGWGRRRQTVMSGDVFAISYEVVLWMVSEMDRQDGWDGWDESALRVRRKRARRRGRKRSAVAVPVWCEKRGWEQQTERSRSAADMSRLRRHFEVIRKAVGTRRKQWWRRASALTCYVWQDEEIFPTQVPPTHVPPSQSLFLLWASKTRHDPPLETTSWHRLQL